MISKVLELAVTRPPAFKAEEPGRRDFELAASSSNGRVV